MSTATDTLPRLPVSAEPDVLSPEQKVKVPLGELRLGSFRPDGKSLSILLSVPDKPADIYSLDLSTGELRALRDEQRPGLDTLPAIEASIETTRAFDGLTIPMNRYLGRRTFVRAGENRGRAGVHERGRHAGAFGADTVRARDGAPAGSPGRRRARRSVLDLPTLFLPEEKLEDGRGELEALLREIGAKYELRERMTVHPTATAADAPVVLALSDAVSRVYARPPALVASPGTYDQKHFTRTGGLDDVVACGPGHLDLADQPDEYVSIADLARAAQVMALATMRLLGASG